MNAMLLDLMARSPRDVPALDVAIKATLILAAAGVAALALRRSSAAARHLAWCLGLGAALALPVLSLALPGWSWRVLPAAGDESHPARTSAAHSPALRPERTIAASLPVHEATFDEEDLLGAEPAARHSRPAAANPVVAPSGSSWRILALSWPWVAWLQGALAVLSTPMAGWVALRRWTRQAEPIDDAEWIALLSDLTARLGLSRQITLLRGARAAMPMTWGWFRPVVLLPADADAWDLDRRRDVLLHELAHVKRLDCLAQAIARWACAVCWFHPLAWVAARRMRIERERACDDVVLLAGARASDYAGHLLEIARGLQVPLAAALAAMSMARPSQLEGRLRAILDPARHRGRPDLKTAAIALLSAILILLPLAMLRLGPRADAAPATVQEPIAGKPATADPEARMTITGRVLDPQGKPVPDAAVMIVLRWKLFGRPTMITGIGPMTAHEGRCDGSGRFRIELPRLTSARQDNAFAVALAPGYGVGWTELDPDAEPAAVDVALRPEQVVRGRLVDVNGQPVRGVAVRILGIISLVRGELSRGLSHPEMFERPRHDRPAWPGPATSDEQGYFTLRGLGREVPFSVGVDDPRFDQSPIFLRTDAGARPLPVLTRMLQVDTGPDAKPITIALPPGRTVTGRITYADTGQPVPHALIAMDQYRYRAGAEGRFRIGAEGSAANRRVAIAVQSPEGAPYLMAAMRFEWPSGAVEHSVDLALTRGAVVRGRRGPIYSLSTDDPRFSLQPVTIRTDDGAALQGRLSRRVASGVRVEPGPDPKPITIAVQPARSLTGRVTYADTGRPVPHALVAALGALPSEADGDGRFRVAASAVGRLNQFLIRAASPDGAPYLVADKDGEWPKGALEQSVDLALPRGVVVWGKVVEEGTGRPVAGAVVRIAPYRSPQQIAGSSCVVAATGSDGTYRVAAPPGPGYLVVQGSDDYVLREFGGDGDGALIESGPGHRRFYAHAYRAVDLKPDGSGQEIDITLRRGTTIRGRVVGPDGRPVPDALVFSRIILQTPPRGGWKEFWVAPTGGGRGRVYDGRFTLHGLDADVEVPVFFLEPERKLGTTVRFSGRSGSAGPVTVRLEPCGTARVRLVDPDGKTVDRYPATGLMSMIVAPGAVVRRNPPNDGPLFATESFMTELDPVNYATDFQSDAQGRVTFPALIPGATYRLVDRSAFYAGGEQEIRKEFIVKPGEALELGDILIAKPRRRN
jgi:beta-lactamase regulating signal transducer with metallopeptidase domain/protocatechuate 3,4-dioxygenase beta subunit